MKRNKKQSMTTTTLFLQAIPRAFSKLIQLKLLLQNPTMSVVYFVNIFLTFYWVYECLHKSPYVIFHGLTLFFLWCTNLFANYAEAVAEGRGKAQASALRALQTDTMAKRLSDPSDKAKYEVLSSRDLAIGDYVILEKRDVVPCDGDVVEGIALVDESAVTGESAPVVREAGGDVSALTGGTVIVSDWVMMKVTHRIGEGFLEQMIQLVEGAKRRKTPNEEALHVVITSFTLIFLIVVATLNPIFSHTAHSMGFKLFLDPFIVVSLLVCLIPTTIGGLLPAISIAGMDRLIRHNILALTPRAIEASGDVDILLLDKTGTITLGNRQAAEFFPAAHVSESSLLEAALISSLSDETPEGKSIVKLARERLGKDVFFDQTGWTFIPFTAKTRMSGVDCPLGSYRKGAQDAIEGMIHRENTVFPQDVKERVDAISRGGGTPLVVSHNNDVIGAIYLKDIIKPGLKDRFMQLRKMGIRTVMVTGDNQLTALSIAAEAGVDECYGEVTPEAKLKLITKFQEAGHMVAMTGDGTNDAPALAKADVAMAMNSGTQAAREAANLVDLDSDPTKLIETIGIGKQLLMTRGALTTFSIANDVAKYFVLIPIVFLPICPMLSLFNLMHLNNKETAVLSCVVFNALIILALVPLALRGVPYVSTSADALFRRNIKIWGLCGVLVPFMGIKLIDMLISLFL